MQILPQKEGAYFRMRLTDKVKDARKNKFYGSRYANYLRNIYRLIFSNYLTMHLISIGIPTLGTPQIERQGNCTLLRNMLIGKDFHWQKSIEALLPGEVELSDDPTFTIINHLPIETYLRCVVGSEMNPDAPEEFLKAHAVISRSWAMGKVIGCHQAGSEGKVNLPDRLISWDDTADHHGFHVCSDDHCQRYQGIQPIPASTLKALESTEGEVLVDSKNHSLIDARFSKCCGGKTEIFSSCWQDQNLPGLRSFDDPWCDLSSLSTNARYSLLSKILKDYDMANDGGFRWEASVDAADIRKNLKEKFGRDVGEIINMRVICRGPSGRITELQLEGDKGILRIGKELMIRRLLAPTHLYSSAFDIEPIHSQPSNGWNLRGKGWGHGVGLCQIGAAHMALSGYSYRDILSFYYPGSQISHI